MVGWLGGVGQRGHVTVMVAGLLLLRVTLGGEAGYATQIRCVRTVQQGRLLPVAVLLLLLCVSARGCVL